MCDFLLTFPLRFRRFLFLEAARFVVATSVITESIVIQVSSIRVFSTVAAHLETIPLCTSVTAVSMAVDNRGVVPIHRISTVDAPKPILVVARLTPRAVAKEVRVLLVDAASAGFTRGHTRALIPAAASFMNVDAAATAQKDMIVVDVSHEVSIHVGSHETPIAITQDFPPGAVERCRPVLIIPKRLKFLPESPVHLT
jgi:hypothetical protein